MRGLQLPNTSRKFEFVFHYEKEIITRQNSVFNTCFHETLFFSMVCRVSYVENFQIKENKMFWLIRYLSFVLLISIIPKVSFAAEVSCGFVTENTFSKSGEWLAQDDNWQKLLEIFPDGISVSLETPLDRKLKSGGVFSAGEFEQGSFYIRGTQHGAEGKVVRVKDEQIIIYDGVCSVD